MKKPFPHGSYYPLLAFLVFSVSFYLSQIYLSPTGEEITNSTILNIFEKYSAFFGIGLALLSMLLSYILILLKKLFRLGRLAILNPFVLILAYMSWLIFAIQLKYFENRYTDIAKAVIDFSATPMLYASIAVIALCIVWIFIEIVKIFKGKAFLPIIMLLPLFSLNGCLGEIQYILCGTVIDSDHCFQGAAVQEGNPDKCEKISGKDFEGMGSNPPKDKCYLLIAENTGNMDACDKIEGGMMSYTKEECLQNVAEKFENPLACEKMNDTDKENCRKSLSGKIDAVKVIEVENQIDVLKKALEDDPEDADLKKQYEDLKARKNAMLGVLTKEEKDIYERNTDPINKLIIGDFAMGDLDSESKESLIKLNQSLKEKGMPFDKESYEKFRDYLIFVKDPKNDIENMDDSELAKDKWRDSLGNAIDKIKFWKSKKTDEEKKYDEQLRFYERMLNRSKAISEKLSEYEQELNEDLEVIGKGLGEYGADKAKSYVLEELLGKGASKATSITSAVLGEALTTVKQEAKSMEFRGLVRSYNLGMEEELSKHGGDVEKAHEAVVKKMTENPYEYETDKSFAKYGNILENKDCNGSNPHCIEKDVFWKAMKKSYKYQNK
jgi:hypothetical protein